MSTQRMMVVELKMGSISVSGEAPASHAGLDAGAGAACLQAFEAFRKKLTPQARTRSHTRGDMLQAEAYTTSPQGRVQMCKLELAPLTKRINGTADMYLGRQVAATVSTTMYKVAKLL